MERNFQVLDEKGVLCLTCNLARWDCRCDRPPAGYEEIFNHCFELVNEKWSEMNQEIGRLGKAVDEGIKIRIPKRRIKINKKQEVAMWLLGLGFLLALIEGQAGGVILVFSVLSFLVLFSLRTRE